MLTSRRSITVVLAACFLLTMVGCARTSKKEAGPPGYSIHVEKSAGGITAPPEGTGIGGPAALPDRTSAAINTPISQMPDAREYGVVDRIHFDYDKSDIKPEWIDGLNNNARWMKDHAEFIMLIEGHCDERGTNEYNMALGERRAMTARNYIIEKGVEPGRIQIKSWGEEKPIAFGHDEASWSQNRRAEFMVGRP